MKKIAVIIYILNLFDLICTLFFLQFGATELNPLLQNPVIMVLIKTLLVGGILIFIVKFPTTIGYIGLKFLLILYSLVAIWHLIGLVLITNTMF